MFTSMSRFVSTETRDLLLAKIREMRPVLSAENMKTTDWWLEGRRYHSDEQCFQGAMQKAIPLHLMMLSLKDADICLLVTEALATTTLESLAREGLTSAASCDYYYTYEKDYGT